MRAPRLLSGQGGFTVLEMMVVAAILGLIMVGIVELLLVGQEGYLRGINQVEAQQSARVAIARLVEEVRGAGYNPTNAAFPAITAQTATGFTIQNDWNGNGVIEPGITVSVAGIPRGEQVTYALVGGRLERQESGVDPLPVVLASGINALAFEYRDAANAVTAAPDLIRTVVITLTTQPERPAPTALGAALVTMTDRARMRNR
jgi:prepilin-type N-terminal cleavage/methylation domain-containing protein